jgi:SnoaL-like protein
MTTAEAEAAAPEAEAAEQWVRGFEEGWRAPTDPDSFADHFATILDPEIRLIQPIVPTTVGIEAFREVFVRPLFELIPDIHGSVRRWSADGDVILIEIDLAGTLAGRPVKFSSVDRVTLRNGLAIERKAFSDPSPVLAAVARNPRAWPRFVRSQWPVFRQSLRGGRT